MTLRPCAIVHATVQPNRAAAGKSGLIGAAAPTAPTEAAMPQASSSAPTAANRREAGSGRSPPNGKGDSRTTVASDQKMPASQRFMLDLTR
jgi:hypothetical protein